MSFRPLTLKKLKASEMLLKISSCANTWRGSQGLSQPLRERAGGPDSVNPLTAMYNTPVRKVLLSLVLQLGNYFRCDIFLFAHINFKKKKSRMICCGFPARKENK